MTLVLVGILGFVLVLIGIAILHVGKNGKRNT
jgi:hypothetical protein